MKKNANGHIVWLPAMMIGLLTCTPAAARGFCSEPLEPYCVTGTLGAAAGKSPAEQLDCRGHLQRYLKALVQYGRCLEELGAETTAVMRDKRRLLDCEHNAALCEGIPGP